MADAPQIKVSGAGSRRDAARLGQTIGERVAAEFAGHDRSLHIDRLRLTLPAGASQAEIDRAIRRELARHSGGNQR
jgi:hypothetical protein